MTWCTAALCAAVLAVIVCSALLLHYRRSLQRTRGELARLRTFHEERMRRPNVLSHELRTPLTVVRGAAELLLDERAPHDSAPIRLTRLRLRIHAREKIGTDLIQLCDRRPLRRRNVQMRTVKAAIRRLIDGKNRIVYRIKGDTAQILQVGTHYKEK